MLHGTLQQLVKGDGGTEDPTTLMSYSYIKHLKSQLSLHFTVTTPAFIFTPF